MDFRPLGELDAPNQMTLTHPLCFTGLLELLSPLKLQRLEHSVARCSSRSALDKHQ
jgi:hypothetical protein